ncbi:MAG: hypothetical protein IJA89_01150, partial [Clostridia bacterium]|nr:hypothetical protein [Clostridia bacterium]
MAIDIDSIKSSLDQQLKTVVDIDALKKLENNFKEVIKELFQEMKMVAPEEKRILGQAINELKKYIEERIGQIREKCAVKQIDINNVDLSIASSSFIRGKIHPLIRVGQMLEDVYRDMGFSVVYGPEIENDKYNYEMLNMPSHHPARDMQDTFYLEYPKILLRSHTS